MNENLVRQAHEMLDAANHASLPQDVEELLGAAQAKAKTIGETIVDNAIANTEAAFAAAQAIARAKTLPEAARLQLEFMPTQLAVATNQTKDLFAMQAEAAQQTYAAL